MADAASRLVDSIPNDIDVTVLPEKSWVYAADGTLLATFYDQNREVVNLDDISPNLRNAVIALEDRRFWTHKGVDLEGMGRAFVANMVGSSSVQGASTLTQQYVKNLLIEEAMSRGDPEEALAAHDMSYARKLREAKRAVALEQKIGKEGVLEGYLNIAQFGSSTYGAEAAANYYFGASAKDLTVVQAATIAATAQSPNLLDPRLHPRANKTRRDRALADMLRDGYITQQEHDEAKALTVEETLSIHPASSGCWTANELAGSAYFCDYVVATIRNSPEFGENRAERQGLLHRGGLRIHTTLDPHHQQLAYEAATSNVPIDDPDGVAVALSTVEPGTGRVLAMAQNRTYPAGEAATDRQTTVNYNADAIYGGSTGFQAGSTFKPFILAEWLSEGHSLTERFDASRSVYTNSIWRAQGCTEKGQYRVLSPWNVRNSGSKRVSSVDAYYATTWSVNTAYVAMEYKLDLCGIQDQLRNLGITRADGEEWHVGPAMVLGANEVSPLAMAAAYAAFAADGVYCEPRVITKVVGPDDKELPVPPHSCTPAMSADVAAGVTSALERVVKGGTGAGANLGDGRPHVGKTGTTDQQVAAWFTGYTRQMSTAVWVGYADASRKLQNVRINGDYYSTVSGSGVPAQVWKSFMGPAHEGLEPASFTPASSAVVKGVIDGVPDLKGLTLPEAEAALEDKGMTVIVGKTVRSSSVPEGRVVSQEPKPYARVPALRSKVTVHLSSGNKKG
jgi:membrane peptidoglycan carboxypeptidase